MFRFPILLSLGVLWTVACSGSERAPREPAASPEEETGAAPRMREVNVGIPKLEAIGREAFAGQCVACHGERGEGRRDKGPRINSRSYLAAASDDFLFRTIEQGRPGTPMIAWEEHLSDLQIWGIIAYVRSWNRVPPADLDESPLEGDAAEGEQVFHSICAACHGRKGGGGYEEGSDVTDVGQNPLPGYGIGRGTAIGRKGFLDAASNGFLRYILRHGKSLTPMRSFQNDNRLGVLHLTDHQIDSVIQYMRESAW